MKKMTKDLCLYIIIISSILIAGCSLLPHNTDPMKVHSAGIIQANGISIAYESYGLTDREVILFINGTGNQLIDWPLELVEEMVRRGYRVVLFDNRDVGLSTKFTASGYPDAAAITEALNLGQPAPIPYTLENMAGDAVGLLDALNIQKAHIVGMSMGGAIAQLVAINYPDRTLSLTSVMASSGNPVLPAIARPDVFVAAPPMPDEKDVEGYINYQVKVLQVISSPDYPTDEKTLQEQVEKDVERSYYPAGLVRQQFVSLVGHYAGISRNEGLKKIKIPTVVVQGAEDPVISVESAQDIADKIPNAKLIIIPGMGHDLPIQLIPTIADAIASAAKQELNNSK